MRQPSDQPMTTAPARRPHDRDSKFTSDFWKTVFRQYGAITECHSSFDRQAERSNQTVETASKSLLIGKYEQGTRPRKNQDSGSVLGPAENQTTNQNDFGRNKTVDKNHETGSQHNDQKKKRQIIMFEKVSFSFLFFSFPFSLLHPLVGPSILLFLFLFLFSSSLPLVPPVF